MDDFPKIDLDHVIGNIGDFTDDAILVTDAEPIYGVGPRIVWVNKAFCRMTGYEAHEVLGKTPRILQGPETKRSDLDMIRKALQAWKPIRIELKNYRKDGSAFWVDLGIQPVTDGSGWHRYWVAVQRETTERYERNQLLYRNSQVLDTAPIALGLLANDGRLTYANEQFHALVFGQATRPLLPMPYDTWLRHGLESAAHDQCDDFSPDKWRRRHLTSLMTSPFKVEQMLKGSWYEFKRLTAPGGDQLLIGENIDARIALQSQLLHMTKMDAMGQLTSGVAHDFNNILAVILGNSELLEEQDTEQTERDALIAEIVSAVLRGRSLTESLLTFARKSRLDPKPSLLPELLQQTVVMFDRSTAPVHRVALTVEEGLPGVLVDPNIFQTAILNLLLNARDASQAGGEIELSATLADATDRARVFGAGAPECVVRVRVSDKGSGMSDQVLQRAIEPFFTTKDAGSGSGLGLSMVRGFVEQSGGALRINSLEGKGTRIDLYFATTPGEDVELIETSERDDLRAGLRILVVEDEAAIRRVLVRTLEKFGCVITQAVTGDEALSMKEKWPEFDVLISDLVMPGRVQGDQLTREFAARCPDTPVLMLSGNPDLLRDIQTSPGKKTEILAKPVQRNDLIATIKRLCAEDD